MASDDFPMIFVYEFLDEMLEAGIRNCGVTDSSTIKLNGDPGANWWILVYPCILCLGYIGSWERSG